MAVNDAVIGLVESPPFVKALAGLVKEKLFEGAVAEANKKLPLTKAQLKRVVEDNSATVYGIFWSHRWGPSSRKRQRWAKIHPL